MPGHLRAAAAAVGIEASLMHHDYAKGILLSDPAGPDHRCGIIGAGNRTVWRPAVITFD